jgi:hypothetical protein
LGKEGILMGIEYELVKPKNGERYDLGKGMWSSVFNVKKGIHFRMDNIFSSYTILYYKLLEKIAFQFEDDITLGFFKSMAEDIVAWCGKDDVAFYDLEMFSDIYHSKDLSKKEFMDKFPYTGTRHGLWIATCTHTEQDIDLEKTIVKVSVPKNWWRFHHYTCGVSLRGCHTTKCPKNVYELTGEWIGPKFNKDDLEGGRL